MSQQEFESRNHTSENEVHQPRYPYTWSAQQGEGMPRDELPGGYDRDVQAAARRGRTGDAQVPWWARPQQQPGNTQTFAVILAIAVLIMLLLGALGIIGLVLGSLAHLIGVLLGAIFALLIFILALAFVAFALIRRAFRRALGYDRRASRRMSRRAWRGW